MTALCYQSIETPDIPVVGSLPTASTISIVTNVSLINTYAWTAGATNATGYNRNGLVSENSLVSRSAPWNSAENTVVWKTTPSGDNAADGGWNTDQFDIDNTKLYRFSVWVKRVSSQTGGQFYLGMFDNSPQQLGEGPRRTIDNATTELPLDHPNYYPGYQNPYWECSGISRFDLDQWYLVVGHVYPYNTTYTGRHPDTGIYTTSGHRVMDISGCNIGDGDIKWGASATKGIHRTYHFYTPDSSSSLEFAGPRVDLIDEDIPGIPTIIDLLRNNGQQYANTFFTGNVILGLTSGANGTITAVSLTESLANISYIPNNGTKFVPGERIISPQPEIVFYSEGTNVISQLSNWNNSNVQYMDVFAGRGPATAHASTGSIRRTVDVVTTTSYWTCPADVYEIKLIAVGGGGAGGADNGGGGGGGAVLYAPSFKTTPGKIYPIVIGAGGQGSALDSIKGYSGSSTIFDDTLVAWGGGAGGSGDPGVGSGDPGGNGGGAAGDDPSAVPGSASTSFTTTKNEITALGYQYFGGQPGGNSNLNTGGGGGGAGGPGLIGLSNTISTGHIVTFATTESAAGSIGQSTTFTFNTPAFINPSEEILIKYPQHSVFTGTGGRKRVRIISTGLNSPYTYLRGVRYVNEDGTLQPFISQSPRSWTVSVFNRGDMNFSNHVSYDIYGNQNEATAMRDYLNSLGSDVIVFIHTHDEPKNNRLTGPSGLEAAMKRCGASAAIFEDEPLWQFRGAYTLVGIPGQGENTGLEQYEGPVSSSVNSFCTMDVLIENGNIVGEIIAAATRIDGVGTLQIDHSIRRSNSGEAAIYPLVAKVGGIGGPGVSFTLSNGGTYDIGGGGSGGNENNFLGNIYATPSIGYGAGAAGTSANVKPLMNGTPNRGGGGGGSQATFGLGLNYQSGNGGSGLVLLEYVLPEELKLTLNNLPNHAELKYKVQVHVVDSYDGETISLLTSDTLNKANLQVKQSGSFGSPPNTITYNKTTSTLYSNLYYSYSPWAANLQSDGYISIDTGWVTHSNTAFFATHNSGLDQGRADEALYLSNVQVLLKNYTPTGIMKTNIARIDEGNVVSYNNVYYRYNGTEYKRVEDPYLVLYYDAANANSYVNGTTVYDLSGCNNNGTISGYNANTILDLGTNKAIKISNQTATGLVGTKINFNANELTANVITVEMWAYVQAFDGGMFFGFENHDVWTWNGTLGFNTAQGDVYGISSTKVAELLLVENWHHYMFVMHKNDYTLNKIYINGVSQILSQQNSIQAKELANFNNGVGRIGGWNADSNYNIPMLLNQFKIYNREITVKEAQRVFESKGESFGKELPKTQTFYSGIAVTANSIVFVDTLGSVNTVEPGTPIKLSNTYGLTGISTDKTYYTYGSNTAGFYITDTYCNAIAEPPVPLSNITGIFLGIGVMDITGDFIIPYIGVQSNLLVSITANDNANVILNDSGIVTWKDTSNNYFDFNIVGSPAFSRHIGNAEIFVNGRLTTDHAFIINSDL